MKTMNKRLKTTLALAALASITTLGMTTQAVAQVAFYERENFRGESFTTERQIANFTRYGFNDRASSVIVIGDRWEVCDDVQFRGRCVILRPGNYASLAALGLNDRVSSVRAVDRDTHFNDNRYAPLPVTDNNYRRRSDERLYEAQVTSVHAVVGASGQRCWVEREQVVQERQANVPGAIAGALIGGIIGHQVGNGRGRDVATVGGAAIGATVGANSGSGGGSQVSSRDVQHCANVHNATPEYWDVTYSFRGEEHRVQMSSPPGSTITVNRQGEPRE